MARDGLSYGKVLTKAQELGYAESDPTADVSGKDTLNKLAILARLSFGADLDVDKVYCEGIETITLDDINYAWELGYVIKLLAIAKLHEDGRVEARVHPTLVDTESIMAYVEDEFNAVEIHGDAVGRQVFYGKGAGMFPTASAVVSDIVDVASCINGGTQTNISRIMVDADGPGIVDISELSMSYYLRFNVKDRPGVLAQIANVFSDKNISIQSVIQYGKSARNSVSLVIMTHESREGDMQKAMKAFSKIDNIKGKVQLIRVENL
jgi:homoserine dehydrogenase